MRWLAGAARVSRCRRDRRLSKDVVQVLLLHGSEHALGDEPSADERLARARKLHALLTVR